RARRRGAVDARFAVAATAVLVTHFVHLLFVFDGASSWLGLVVFLAFLDRATRPSDAPVGPPGQRGWVLVAAALGGGVLLAAAWVVAEWRTMRAADEALDRLAAGQGRAAEAAFVRALEGDPPHADGARDMFAVGALRQAARMAGAPSPELDRV